MNKHVTDDEALDLSPFPKRLSAEVVRPLTLEDAARALEPKTYKTPVATVLRFRDTHHRLARYLAMGFRDQQVSALTGYSSIRISILKSDPAFMDLVAVYAKSVGEEGEEVLDLIHERKIKSERVQVEYLDQVLDKRDSNGHIEPAEVRLAMDMSSDANDRVGHVKRNVEARVNLDLADRLGAARKRSLLDSTGVGLGPVGKEPVVE
jgi:hypothetical protein